MGHFRHDGVQLARRSCLPRVKGLAYSGDFGRAALWHALRPWIFFCVWQRRGLPTVATYKVEACLCVCMYYQVAFQ